MKLVVREMALSEVGLIVDYFHHATAEHLEMMGVDPSRLPPHAQWLERYVREYEQPIELRKTYLVAWLLDDRPIGFSTSDKIAFGEQANMHLHIIDVERRGQGLGTQCVKRTADIYFDYPRDRAGSSVGRAADS